DPHVGSAEGVLLERVRRAERGRLREPNRGQELVGEEEALDDDLRAEVLFGEVAARQREGEQERGEEEERGAAHRQKSMVRAMLGRIGSIRTGFCSTGRPSSKSSW